MSNEEIEKIVLKLDKISASIGIIKKDFDVYKIKTKENFENLSYKINSNMKDSMIAKGIVLLNILLTLTVVTIMKIIEGKI